MQSKRKELKLSQQEVANQFFVSRQTISSWETGKSFPDVPTLIKLSDFYDVTLDYLIKGDENLMKKISADASLFKLLQQFIFVSVFGIFAILASLGTFAASYKNISPETGNFVGNAPMYLLMTVGISWLIFFYIKDMYIKTDQLNLKVIQFVIHVILFLSFVIPLFLAVLSILIIAGVLSI